mmetsp:Transcript_15490/g.33390  ORF Transcript_15490/g.33390 Transcript_15490/m.33390 type:complete len:507 (+) Transcript_15490:992-2512(+)
MRGNRRTSLLRIATWTLSNLCDGQPRPTLDVDSVLDTIKIVLDTEDTEVLSHACWALSHLCDGPSPHIQAVVNADVGPRLVELLHNKSWRVVKPALRTVGNIVCAEDEHDHTQQIIECGAVPCLRKLIGHSNREIQKEACWTLSNIAAGTSDQIQCVLNSGSIPPLVELASREADTDPDVKIEACWVLLNATSCGSDSQIETLVSAGCVSVLCNLLQDNSMIMMALEGLEKILQVGEDISARSVSGTNPHASLLDTAKIEALQNHRSTAIAKRAARMWKRYFVICAICNTAYSRHSPDTKFCYECKCNVCTNCDCSVFHLSYQNKLWKELAEGEAKVEKSKQQSKKTKRQKKRAKDKKRKELLKAKSNGVSKLSNASKDQSPSKDTAATKTTVPADEPANDPVTPPEPPATKEGEGNVAKSKNGSDTEEEGLEDDERQNSLSSSNKKSEQKQLPIEEIQELESPKTCNEEYVDFLSNNGSILDLWKMINENENTKTEDLPQPIQKA